MESFHPLISCIIPVYNARRYLEQGVASLIRQSYSNIEIILVDDRSTDDSWAMCQEYARKYKNVRAFRNRRNSGGPLRGRERGIVEARGDWITFIDCDDYVEVDYIKNLLEATDFGKFDIAVTGHSRLYSNGKKEDFLWSDYSQTTAERLASFYDHFLRHDFWTDPTDTVGQNLIRASICKATDLANYSSRIYAEDTIMALAFLSNSKNGVNFVDKHDFNWRQLEGSGSHGGFSESADKVEFFEAMESIFHKNDIYSAISLHCPLISVVVPVYNVQNYLEECLESIFTQTYKNIEVIVVNDGSSDGSQKIIDNFKKINHNLISLKQKNKGLNMARAAGVEVAGGKYISFVDSDDMIHKDYLKYLYENLIENGVDISVCGMKNFLSSKDLVDVKVPQPIHAEQVMKERGAILKYYLWEIPVAQNVHPMTAWAKLYRTDIVKATDWLFSNYRRHEDNLESLQWYERAVNGVAIQSVELYYYRKNPKSITQTIQLNTNPEGQSINYFEYLRELHQKINTYIQDDTYDVASLNQFAQTNSIQIQNYFTNNQLDKESLESGIQNWYEIVNLYNNEIQKRDQAIFELNQRLADVYESSSWKITEPLRRLKSSVKRPK